MLHLFKYFKVKEWLFALIATGFIVMQVWLEIKIPDYMSELSQIINFSTDSSMKDIWINGGWMLACAFGSMACAVATSFFVAQIAANFSARLREAVYGKV